MGGGEVNREVGRGPLFILFLFLHPSLNVCTGANSGKLDCQVCRNTVSEKYFKNNHICLFFLIMIFDFLMAIPQYSFCIFVFLLN